MIIVLFFTNIIIIEWKKPCFHFSNFHYEKNDNKLLFIIIKINE